MRRMSVTSLNDRLQAEMLTAMRAKDTQRVSVIRQLKSRVTYKLKEPGAPAKLSDGAIVAIVQQAVADADKTLAEIDGMTSERAEQLRESAHQERAILSSFLPEQLAPEQVEALVEEVVAQQGAKSVKDMRGVMQELNNRLTAGSVDPKKLGQVVKQRLQKD